MVQTSTTRSLFRTLPGHMYSPPQERETESLCAPFTLQQLTITLAGADPFAAEATLEIVFPLQDGSGLNGQVDVTIPNTTTLADAAALVATAWNANAQAGALYSASANAAVITLVARSANTSIAAASIVGTFSDAHTATTAQTVAAGAPSLEMGLFYEYATIALVGPAITGTPRGARPARLPNGSSTIDTLRGVVARETNSTMLSPTFIDSTTFDTYPAGFIFPGMRRGRICARVSPESAVLTLGSALYVVIAVGTNSVVGAVTSLADGGNTIRIDNAPAGNFLGTVTAREETFTAFTGFSGRFVPIAVNRTFG